MSLDIVKHKNILIKILKDIYTDHSLGPVLGFKGGTAAYLFYDLKRFSVDLDFDLLASEKQDFVLEKVKKILEKYGIVKEAKKKKHNLLYVLSYKEKVPKDQNVRVEINLRDFGSKYDIKAYLGISMKVMIKEDMTAHKLVAMFERLGRTNRDIFDVWYFLQNDWPINRKIVEERTKTPFKKFLKKCISTFEKISDKDILSGMGELLDAKQKIWAKTNLKKDVIFLLRILLDQEK